MARWNAFSIVLFIASICPGLEMQRFVQDYGRSYDFEKNVEFARNEILKPTGNVFPIGSGAPSPRFLARLLQRPLTRVHVTATVNSHTKALPGFSATKRRVLENMIILDLTDSLNRYGIATFAVADDQFPSIVATSTVATRTLDKKTYYQLLTEVELIKVFKDPETGMSIPCKMWGLGDIQFLQRDFGDLEAEVLKGVPIQGKELILAEYKKAVFREAFHRLKKENKLPQDLTKALASYEDW